ncbi:hypothetical protein BABINDRAFT_41263, partial [Babjeviella inositovora NRRL Y-12698]
QVKRTVRVTTEQHVREDIPQQQEGFPMREWSITVSMLDLNGKEIPATIFDKVTYHLHPTFVNPTRAFKEPPFRITEEGWGEFDMMISFHFVGKGERKLSHDLNFLKEKYTVDHVISIPTKNPVLNKLLLESGPVPGFNPDEAALGDKRKGEIAAPAKTKKSKTAAVKGNVDLEKLANGLTRLGEDDLIVVVQMVTDNKTADMNIKNDVDEGEFTMDLYTLPDSLLKSLWDYVEKHAK